MFLSDMFLIYVHTADHCQLKCRHCFNFADKKPKTFFNVDKTVKWFEELYNFAPHVQKPSINFFGGEPLLAPPQLMMEFMDRTKHLWKGNLRYMITSNLVMKLTEDKLQLLRRLDGVSTSWDKDIRFEFPKQFELWKSNCIQLIKKEKIPLTLQVSLSKETIAMDVEEIYAMAKEIGFHDVQFEKLSLSGNLFDNYNIIPNNTDLDNWFMDMYHKYVKGKYYKNFSNAYLNSILSSMLYSTRSGCRSRNCETKIFTINADGTIGNCPNNASYAKYQIGTLDDSIRGLMLNPQRRKNISCEAIPETRCLECPVYKICAGGCVRSTTEMWKKDDPQCPEAKSLMKFLLKENKVSLYNTLLNGFMSSEGREKVIENHL